jgi:hypothetical protein
MEDTPFEQVVLAVAENVTGEPTLLLFAGAVTYTPVFPLVLTVILMGVVAAPPHLSHSSTVVL